MRDLGPFLRDAWLLARPYFNSSEKWVARGLLASVVALNLLTVGLTVLQSFWGRAFYNALGEKDWGAFLDLIYRYRHTPNGWVPGFIWFALVWISIGVLRSYMNQWLRIRWRNWMTGRLLDSWLADRAYYRLSLEGGADGTDNPDQRIADDLSSFVTDGLTLALGLLSSVVSFCSFVAILWSLSGDISVLGLAIPGYMVWIALAYAATGTVFTHLVGKPLAALDFRQQKVEADFRFSLARFRENVEGVALYGGEAEEQRGLAERFAAIVANFRAIMVRTVKLNMLVVGYSQTAIIFPLLVVAPRYFAGAITLGAMQQTSGAFGSVESALSFFVNAYSSFASWRATTMRLATFQRAIERARAAAGEGVVQAPPDGADLALDHATVALPDGTALLQDVSMVLRRGVSVLIAGRSGAGKSTLFRALAGIWPFGSGTVRKPEGTTLFLPQRPYLPQGTLRRAATYPADPDVFDDATVIQALRDVGLAELTGQIDADANWSLRLSGGEQQRLAIARALLTRPDWLFLDEATSNLDAGAEAELYGLLKRALPGTTVISIAHRPSLAAMHDAQLLFDRVAPAPGRLAEAA